jgi:hypothetical protein
MLSSQEDQRERRETLRNDQRVREQSGTLHQHGQASANDLAGGRWSGMGAYVVGSKPDVASAYPAASAAHQIQLPDEEPTGYRIDTIDAPSLAVEPVGSPLSSETVAAQRKSQMSSSSLQVDGVRTERPPWRRL